MAGPEFFQTIMGKRFFEGQLPRLIKNLGRIADVLEASKKGPHGEDVFTVEQWLSLPTEAKWPVEEQGLAAEVGVTIDDVHAGALDEIDAWFDASKLTSPKELEMRQALNASACRIRKLNEEVLELKFRAPRMPFDVRCADALADEVEKLVKSKELDSRSPAADALLDYRDRHCPEETL